MKFCFITFLLIFAVQFIQFGCEPKTASRISTEGWKTIEKPDFTISIPASMTEHKVQGSDTLVYKFEDSNISLDIEYGFQAFANVTRSGGRDFNETSVDINGRKAKLYSYSRTLEGQKEMVSVLFFRNRSIDDSYPNLVIWASYKTDDEKEIALSIFNSVKFKS
jgi:hypothetical protein